MLHKTSGIVLRSVKYGESSLIVNIFTELFGVQAYLVNGVRSSRPSSRAALLQPANLLDLVAYHHEGRNLQRLSDFRYGYLYRSLYTDMIKNSIALFLVELLDKSLRQPEVHPELFWFISGALQWMDREQQAANLPLYVCLRVGELLGFRLLGRYSEATPYLDLQEGCFTARHPAHPHFLEEDCGRLTDGLLQTEGFDGLRDLKMDKQTRQRLLAAYQDYYRLHLPGFTGLRSPKILADVLA